MEDYNICLMCESKDLSIYDEDKNYIGKIKVCPVNNKYLLSDTFYQEVNAYFKLNNKSEIRNTRLKVLNDRLKISDMLNLSKGKYYFEFSDEKKDSLYWLRYENRAGYDRKKILNNMCDDFFLHTIEFNNSLYICTSRLYIVKEKCYLWEESKRGSDHTDLDWEYHRYAYEKHNVKEIIEELQMKYDERFEVNKFRRFDPWSNYYTKILWQINHLTNDLVQFEI